MDHVRTNVVVTFLVLVCCGLRWLLRFMSMLVVALCFHYPEISSMQSSKTLLDTKNPAAKLKETQLQQLTRAVQAQIGLLCLHNWISSQSESVRTLPRHSTLQLQLGKPTSNAIPFWQHELWVCDCSLSNQVNDVLNKCLRKHVCAIALRGRNPY